MPSLPDIASPRLASHWGWRTFHVHRNGQLFKQPNLRTLRKFPTTEKHTIFFIAVFGSIKSVTSFFFLLVSNVPCTKLNETKHTLWSNVEKRKDNKKLELEHEDINIRKDLVVRVWNELIKRTWKIIYRTSKLQLSSGTDNTVRFRVHSHILGLVKQDIFLFWSFKFLSRYRTFVKTIHSIV